MSRRRLEASLRHRAARDGILRVVRESARAAEVSAWLVGGYVRDAALEHPPGDIDLVAGAGAARLVRQIETTAGRRAFRFRKRGVTTWRLAIEGRHVDLVDASRRGLRRDLERRDFTLNAVAFDLVDGKLVDPLKGLNDLRARRLRTPHAGVMSDDPLRALRAARLVAQFPGFRLTPAASREASAVGPRLARVSVERIRNELDKLLMAAAPRRGLEQAQRLGLVDVILPELKPLRSCVAGQDRPDVWRHTLDALGFTEQPGRRRLPGHAVVRDPTSRRVLRWALLLHDISKPETLEFRADGRPTFHGHESLGSKRVDALLRRLRLPKAERNRVRRLVTLHLRPSLLAEAGTPGRGLRRLVREAGHDVALLALHSAADALASGSPDAEQRWRRLRRTLLRMLDLGRRLETAPLPKLLDGRDVIRLMRIEPGPGVGKVLNSVRRRQEGGVIRTRREALAFVAELASRRKGGSRVSVRSRG